MENPIQKAESGLIQPVEQAVEQALPQAVALLKAALESILSEYTVTISFVKK